MPPSEKTEDRLTMEAQVVLTAGTITSARTIGVATYHILSRPTLRSKLEEELDEIMTEWPQKVPTVPELEKLPLLQAIVKEALRWVLLKLRSATSNSSLIIIQHKLRRDAPITADIS